MFPHDPALPSTVRHFGELLNNAVLHLHQLLRLRDGNAGRVEGM